VSKDKYGYVSVDLRVKMFSKSSMYLTLQRRILGVENVVEEEEYNQFDEIPSFDTSYRP
jgi:hypothetical protein